MAEPLRIALAGLGTVGAGVIRLIEANGALIARRAGRPIEVIAVSARDRDKDRGVDLSRFRWEDDMTALAARDDVDVVVELVGGADGPALTLARTRSPRQGAGHREQGDDRPSRAGARRERRSGGVAAEVRGGGRGRHPGDQGPARGRGGQPARAALRHPQRHLQFHPLDDGGHRPRLRRGAARRAGPRLCRGDPSFDVEGTDAAHKLAILAAIGFGTRIDFAAVEIEASRALRAADIAQAEALGYVIRLIGMADCEAEGRRRPCSSASSRIWCRSIIRSRMSTAPPMRLSRRAISPAGCCSRARARATGRPPARWLPTSSTSRAATTGAPFSVPVAELEAMPRGRPGPPPQPRLYPLHRRRPARRAGRDHRGDARRRGVDRKPDPEGPAEDGGEVLVAMVTHEGPGARGRPRRWRCSTARRA